MSKIRKAGWLVVVLLAALMLAACGGDDEKKSYVIGAIMQNPTSVETWEAFKTNLADKGYVEGENITYYIEPSGPLLAAEVAADDLDLVFVIGGAFGASEINSLTQAKALAGGSIPILIAPGSGDPVASGDAASLAKPGKNITGLLMLNADDKRFEFFVDMLPESAKQVAIIYDPDHTEAVEQLAQIELIAERAGLDVLRFETPSMRPETTEQAFAGMPEDIDGIFLLKVWGTSVRWYEWAYAHGVPTSQDGIIRQSAVPQPLMSYGPSLIEMGSDGARLADQILKGAKPGDLPFEYPDFYLTVDLALGEAIGFEVPDQTLSRADEIRRGALTVYTSQPIQLAASTISHEAGTGSCAGTITTMGGTFTICVTVSCDQLENSTAITYSDRTDVGACSTGGLVGICAAADFDTYYYDGEAGMLQIGCGFMSGKWTIADE